MTEYILPILILALVGVGLIMRVNVYDSFVRGGRNACSLIYNIFPYLFAVLMLIELFKASGLDVWLSKLFAPFLEAIGLPKELSSLIILRPLSGSGAIAMLQELIEKYGVDSYIARSAAIIVGASETVFYVATVYFSTSKVKSLRYGVPVALFSSFVGVVVACLLARFI